MRPRKGKHFAPGHTAMQGQRRPGAETPGPSSKVRAARQQGKDSASIIPYPCPFLLSETDSGAEKVGFYRIYILPLLSPLL